MAGDGDTGSHMPDICRAPRRFTVAILTSGNATHGAALGPSTPTERSLIELTNTRSGCRHRSGTVSVSGWIVSANPGPLVRGSPSCWYLAWPIALRRLAMAIA